MKYRFYGDELQLVKYIVSVIPQEENAEPNEFTAVTEDERDRLLEYYPEAIVTEVDNTGYEWLDGMTFTQKRLKAGEVDKAIEMGEAAYKDMLNMPSQEEINAMLMLEIAKLKAGVNNG